MNLTNWNLSTPTQIIIVSETLVAGFILASVFVVHFVYLPWVEKLEEEIEPVKYEDGWKLQDYWDEEERMNGKIKDAETNENNIVNDATPEGNVFMKYSEDNEGFEYWCDDKNIKYDYLDTVARKYCILYNCFGKYNDRKESIKEQEEQEKEEEQKEEEEKETKEEEESIFVKQKKIETKKIDRSKGSVALKSNKFIYKGKVGECPSFLKTRDDELQIKTKKNMSFAEWISSSKKKNQ